MINNMRLLGGYRSRSRRGIALVVVLGMLALLVMIGVAFSVFMRTERQAAGSFQHDVRARQLLMAAQTRALEAIEKSMAGRVYPDWLGLVSPGTGIPLASTDSWGVNVPDNLLLDPQFPKTAGWISVPNGRVGYLVVNASGLLDANTVGGKTRANGTDPKEIDLAGVSDVANSTTFINGRPYESIVEMKRAKAAIGLSGDAFLSDYSLVPTNTASTLFDLSGSDGVLSGKRGQIKAILDANFPALNSDMVIDALLDYVDADSLPRSGNLNAPCSERVPMINEVRIRPVLIANAMAGGVDLLFQTTVEMFYPFVSIKTGKYKVAYSITVKSTAPAGFPAPAAALTGISTEFSFLGEVFKSWNITPGTRTLITCVPWGGTQGSYDITIDYLRLLDSGGTVLDQVENLKLSAAANTFPKITIPVAPAPVNDSYWGGLECADPRFNYMNNFWFTYRAAGAAMVDTVVATNGTMSPATTNAIARFWLARAGTDGHIWMHTADQPLQSPAELSYLIRGAAALTPANSAWKTLRLLDEGAQKADPIFSSFTVSSTNKIQRGFINPNTDVPDVLAAAMRKMPLDRYPGDPDDAAAVKVSSATALTLANAWLSDPSIGAYMTKSDMISNALYRLAVSNAVNAMLPGLSVAASAKEFRYEAGFRNLLGLMNARQNYFIILLFGQSSASVKLPNSTKTIETVRADQTALLELWRDPVSRVVTNAGAVSTNYPMVIRRFDILSQE